MKSVETMICVKEWCGYGRKEEGGGEREGGKWRGEGLEEGEGGGEVTHWCIIMAGH